MDESSFDFNQVYAGYYPRCDFTASASVGDRRYLAGYDDAGLPHLFEGTNQNVWTERNITTHFQSIPPNDYGRIIAILFEPENEQLFLVAENGYLVTIPECSKCVVARKISSRKLTAGWMEDDIIHVTGDNAEEILCDVYTARQVRCAWSYALPLLSKGILIDLRSSEQATFSLPGSIRLREEHLDLLWETYSRDHCLFFVCKSGFRADEAARQSRERGFNRAYSLGGEWELIDEQVLSISANE